MAERDFHHPFKPYDIQKQLMSAIYDCLEDGKVGIFESPTGTGKTLSIICGSLTWLRDHKRRRLEGDLAAIAGADDEPEWLIEQSREEAKRSALRRSQELKDRLQRIREQEKQLRQRPGPAGPPRKRAKATTEDGSETADEARFVLGDYESDDEMGQRRVHKATAVKGGLSGKTESLLKQLGLDGVNSSTDNEKLPIDETRIFFCSRTHSQLSQFVGELKRVKMPASMPSDSAHSNSDVVEDPEEDIRQLALGSRKHLCVNPKLQDLPNVNAMNERCVELQQPNVAADQKCPFLPAHDDQEALHRFRDHAISKIRDIEDLGQLGKKLGVCPYYGTRSAIAEAEVVTLPYPLLLSKIAREALALSMKDQVIIIDEAHNLMDTINSIHSTSVSFEGLREAREQLGVYLQKFRNRLKGQNRVYIAQVVRVIDSLVAFLQEQQTAMKGKENIATPSQLLAGKGVDQIDLYKLLKYLNESKLAHKVDGYTVHTEEQATIARKQKRPQSSMAGVVGGKSTTALTTVQNFLLCLINPSKEGRFFYSRSEADNGLVLRYMLLDPTFHFRELVDEARAVLLLGGTMSPMADYENHLLSYLPKDRLMTRSCGHVIPKSNLLAMPITGGASGMDLEFTFEKRNSRAAIHELGQSIRLLSTYVPDGVVVFFPSYAYLEQCVRQWKSGEMWNTLNAKPVFYESRSHVPGSNTASTADSPFALYSAAIRNPREPHRGALLFAVVGGALSEGINFSDELGRCVMVVGLPFPDPNSAEWKAKTSYIITKAKAEGRSEAEGKAMAREFYENTCMRAVNQSVGRAIRHKGDYASILLLDSRYNGERIQKKLPGWIKESVKTGRSASAAIYDLKAFFRFHGHTDSKYRS